MVQEKPGRLRLLGCALAAAFLTAGSAWAEDITVYTALEDDQLAAYKDRLRGKDHPDITINWVRDSTGPITARLLAEKANRQADAVWGLAATSLLVLDGEGMLEGYAPKDVDALKPSFRMPPIRRNGSAWTPGRRLSATTCRKARPKGVPQPASWADLLKPEFKGHIVMSNPASSGTGYLTVSAILQLMGEEKGWEYLDELHENIATLPALRLEALRERGQGRIRRRHLVRVSRRAGEEQGRADRDHPAVGRHRLGHGGDRDHDRHRQSRCRQEAADFAASDDANKLYAKSYSVTALSRTSPARSRTIPTTKSS